MKEKSALRLTNKSCGLVYNEKAKYNSWLLWKWWWDAKQSWWASPGRRMSRTQTLWVFGTGRTNSDFARVRATVDATLTTLTLTTLTTTACTATIIQNRPNCIAQCGAAEWRCARITSCDGNEDDERRLRVKSTEKERTHTHAHAGVMGMISRNRYSKRKRVCGKMCRQRNEQSMKTKKLS